MDKRVWSPQDGGREAQATPDGSHLVFVSSADLTTGDTSKVTQVFEYDAETQSLVRVSTGANPTVSAEAANIPPKYITNFLPSEASIYVVESLCAVLIGPVFAAESKSHPFLFSFCKSGDRHR